MKYAVYAATKEHYDKLIPAVKSLLVNSDVDKVYLLIEDDALPFDMPKEAKCINVSKLNYFRVMSPNNVYPWAYMSMMRAALCKVLPDVDVVLSLDTDTIVNGDISGLWDEDIEDYYFAAVREPVKSTNGRLYTNTGVALFNLKKMRDGKADEIINALNWRRFEILEQDALNALCQGHIKELPFEYNSCSYTDVVKNAKIVHFTGDIAQDASLVQDYAAMPAEEIRKPIKRRSMKQDDDVQPRGEKGIFG